MDVTNGGNEEEDPGGSEEEDPGRAQTESTRAKIDSTRAGTDSTRALVDSTKAGTDSVQAGSDSVRAQEDSDRAQTDSDRKDRRSLYRIMAYLFMGLCASLAVWRLETAVQKIEDNEEIEDAREVRDDTKNCTIRNTAIRNGRDRVAALLNGVEFVLNRDETDPAEIAENIEIVDRLQEAVSADGEEEDLDCNNDGELNELDYSP